MNSGPSWTIIGDDPLSDELRDAAQYIETTAPMIVTTDPEDIPASAIATGSALLARPSQSVVSPLVGIRVLEDIQQDVKLTDTEDLYGCFASHRIVAGTNPDDTLIDLLAFALEMFQSPITRVYAQRASLRKDDDAWFVHLRARSDVLITLEVIAMQPAEIGDELRVEVTSRDRVWSASPYNQAVHVNRVDGPPARRAWLENRAERMLQVIRDRQREVRSGERLREVWSAIQHSASDGQAVNL